ncbi:Uncharacterised protein [Mycobacteroides abscessus subsp. abscessus]|nr:Uncharacterised protein [Mycobacteroides abscessus subsp. abscessus]
MPNTAPWRDLGNSAAISARVCADISAALIPWAPRQMISSSGLRANPHSTEVTVNATIAKMNIRRRPSRPPSVAAVSSVQAKASV